VHRSAALVSHGIAADYNLDMPADQPAKRHRRRSWFRYSLGTLLIGLTIGCVWLGFIVNRAQRQQRAVAMVRELNGYAIYDIPKGDGFVLATPEFPATWRGQLGIDLRGNVVAISVPAGGDTQELKRMRGPNDRDLAKLRHLNNLENLHIRRGDISEQGCRHLATLPSLRYLCLTETPISEEGLAQIGGIRTLEHLSLIASTGNARDPITGNALRHLTELKCLTELDLSGTDVDDVGLEHLTKLPRLKSLRLCKTRITNEGLRAIAKMPLESLFIAGTQVDDEGIVHLARMTTLERLDIEVTNVSRDGFDRLKQSLRGCKDIVY
jgi:Leucine Rich Repeat (LRR) protein